MIDDDVGIDIKHEATVTGMNFEKNLRIFFLS